MSVKEKLTRLTGVFIILFSLYLPFIEATVIKTSQNGFPQRTVYEYYFTQGEISFALVVVVASLLAATIVDFLDIRIKRLIYPLLLLIGVAVVILTISQTEIEGEKVYKLGFVMYFLFNLFTIGTLFTDTGKKTKEKTEAQLIKEEKRKRTKKILQHIFLGVLVLVLIVVVIIQFQVFG